MLGLGVFGFVDVTVVGVVAVGGVDCRVTGFKGGERKEILKLFSLRRPFVLKCIDRAD